MSKWQTLAVYSANTEHPPCPRVRSQHLAYFLLCETGHYTARLPRCLTQMAGHWHTVCDHAVRLRPVQGKAEHWAHLIPHHSHHPHSTPLIPVQRLEARFTPSRLPGTGLVKYQVFDTQRTSFSYRCQRRYSKLNGKNGFFLSRLHQLSWPTRPTLQSKLELHPNYRTPHQLLILVISFTVKHAK